MAGDVGVNGIELDQPGRVGLRPGLDAVQLGVVGGRHGTGGAGGGRVNADGDVSARPASGDGGGGVDGRDVA